MAYYRRKRTGFRRRRNFRRRFGKGTVQVRRRRFTRRGRGRGRIQRVNRIPGIVRKLRYVTKITLSPGGVATVRTHSFRGNSLYDPDSSGVGHQPLGFDQIMTLYRDYRVRGSKIHCEVFMKAGATSNNEGYLFIEPSILGTSAITNTGVEVALEKPNMLKKHMAWGTPYSVPSANSLSMYRSTRSMYPGQDVKGPDYIGNASADPNYDWHWHIHWLGLATTAADVDVVVTIDFYAHFTDPIIVGQS